MIKCIGAARRASLITPRCLWGYTWKGRIEVPPLRERLEDLPALVDHYVHHFRRAFGKRVVGFNSRAMDLLFSYSWPGNIRELKNVLEAAFVSLPDQSNGKLELPSPIAPRLSLSSGSNATERIMLLEALTASNWNRTEAAKKLQWSRMTLYRKMIRYHVEPTRAKR